MVSFPSIIAVNSFFITIVKFQVSLFQLACKFQEGQDWILGACVFLAPIASSSKQYTLPSKTCATRTWPMVVVAPEPKSRSTSRPNPLSGLLPTLTPGVKSRHLQKQALTHFTVQSPKGELIGGR